MVNSKQSIACFICHSQLAFRPARGRKSGKLFIMVLCPDNARHFRGFISDQDYVAGVLARLEGRTPAPDAEDGLDIIPPPYTPSKTNLERGSGS